MTTDFQLNQLQRFYISGLVREKEEKYMFFPFLTESNYLKPSVSPRLLGEKETPEGFRVPKHTKVQLLY